jgi:hypothetical protein
MAAYALWLARAPLPPPRPSVVSPVAATAALLRDRRAITLGVLDALFSPLDEPLLAFLIVAYVTGGRAPWEAAAVVTAVVVGGLAGFAFAGRLRRGGPVRPALVMAFALVVVVAQRSLAPGTVAAFAFGAAAAVYYVRIRDIELRLVPGHAGATTAVVSTLGLAGIAFVPFTGWVADRAGPDAALWCYAMLPFLVALVAAVTKVGAARQPSRDDPVPR